MPKLALSLRVLVSGAWLSYVALSAWIEPAFWIACKIINPLGQMLFFVYLGTIATGRETAGFYLVGNALQMAALNGVFGLTMVIGNERNAGTLVYLIGSPAQRLTIFWGRALFYILDGIFTVVLCFAWGALLGLDLRTANLPGLALTIVIAAISTCGLGFVIGSVSLVGLNVMFLNNTIYFLLMVFSGANLPLDKMPGWMQAISASVPLTRGIQSARLLVNGASLADVLPLLAGELAVGLVYALAGFALFRWIEFQARRRGTLEVF